MKIKRKDITTVDQGIIAHGVNCQRRMGSGVAKALYTKWPEIKSDYLECDPCLGLVDWVLFENPYFMVANCYTQEYYGYDGKQYADYDAVTKCISECLYMAKVEKLPLFIPQIGSGLGGLDWDKVASNIQLIEKAYNYELTVCTL